LTFFEDTDMPEQSFILKPVALSILIGLYGVSSAYANPRGGQVMHGQALIDASRPGVLNVTNSPNAVIHWRSFSNRPNEIVRFIQQSGNSAVLNRVIGQDPSRILGQLLSNGRVFLINPNGIIFGENAVVDTGGLLASTLNLSDQDFLKGNYVFTNEGAGHIKNHGLIHTQGNGNIVLVAPKIENTGVIRTERGELVLAAGEKLTLSSLDSPEIKFEIQAPDNQVVNLGQLLARQGGAVDVFAGTIRNQGTIDADSVSVDARGRIVLEARQDIHLAAGSAVSATGPQGGSIRIESREGATVVAGRVEAKGTDAEGGEARILGERVGLIDRAEVDVSGAQGGGTALIGGDWQGRNPAVHNAKAVYVDKNAGIRADAGKAGNGGKVVVWADEATRFYGGISARGGSEGGDGGAVETSGRYLDAQGTVDASAPKGRSGDWLLDPFNIVIKSAGPDFNVSPGPDWTTTGLQAVLTTKSIENALNLGTSVKVTTGHDGSIQLLDPIEKTAGGDATLTLRAYNDIDLDAGITSTSSKLNLVLDADTGQSGTGAINLFKLGNPGSLTLDANGGTINAKSETLNLFRGIATINSPLTVKSLHMADGTLALGDRARIRVSDEFEWAKGTLSGTDRGKLELLETATLNFSGENRRTVDGPTLSTNGFTLSTGSFDLKNGNLKVGGTVTIAKNAEIDFSGGAFQAGTFYNDGLVNIDAKDKALSLFGGIHSGTFNVASGSALRFTVPEPGQAAPEFRRGAAITGSGTVIFDLPRDLRLPRITAETVDLSVTGAVTQAEPIEAATLSLSGGNYTLTSANRIGAVAGTAGSLNFRDDLGFDVAGLTVGGNAVFTTPGTVTQSGALNAASLELRGSGTYRLETLANDIGVLSGQADELALAAAGDLAVGALSVGGPVTLTAPSGAITDANGSTRNIVAERLTLAAGQGIELDTQAGEITALNGNDGDIVLRNTGDLVLKGFVSGDCPFTICSSKGALSLANAGTVEMADGKILFAHSGIDLSANGADSDIRTGPFQAESTVALAESGRVALNAGRDILLGQVAATRVGLNGTGTVEVAAGRDVVLGRLAGVTAQDGDITVKAGGNVRLLAGGGHIATGHSGNIDISAKSGDISLGDATLDYEPGAGSGTAEFSGIRTAGAGSVALKAGNDVLLDKASAIASRQGDIAVNAARHVKLLTADNRIVSEGSGSIRVSAAAGDIAIESGGSANGIFTGATGSIALQAGHQIRLDGQGIRTDADGNIRGGNIAATAGTGGMVINAAIAAPGAEITLTSAGPVLQNSSATIIANGLTLDGRDTAFNLAGPANAVATVKGSVGSVAFSTLKNFEVGGLTAGDAVTFNTPERVTQSAPLRANALVLNGDGGNYDLSGSGNAIAKLSGNTGSIRLINHSAPSPALLSIGKISATRSVKLNNFGKIETDGAVTSGKGAVSLIAHSPLTVGANIRASGNVTLSAGNGQAASDTLALNGGNKVTSKNGDVSLFFNGTFLGDIASVSAPNGKIFINGIEFSGDGSIPGGTLPGISVPGTPGQSRAAAAVERIQFNQQNQVIVLTQQSPTQYAGTGLAPGNPADSVTDDTDSSSQSRTVGVCR
jgi:filamentous hemagglutinin family protein